jgi:SPX domain protein involved in polyphosphate accumulation
MTSRKTRLHEIEIQFNPLYFEISLLKFRLGEASPTFRTQYRDLISNLSAQYNFVGSQVRSLQETENDLPEEQITLAQQNLRDLQKTFDTVGHWIYNETANQVCSYY